MKRHAPVASAASLFAFRRRFAPTVSVLTFAAFLMTLAPAHRAEASQVDATPSATLPPTRERADIARSGVESHLMSMQGMLGSAQGMGGAFTTHAGSSTYTYSFALPRARGVAQPGLALSYSSTTPQGVAGLGFLFGTPSITRLPAKGTADSRPAPSSGFDATRLDRYVTSDGNELLYICELSAGATCPQLLEREAVPAWAAGMSYFRARVDGSFDRYFLSKDRRTFRVQSKAGVTYEFGAALDGSSNALQMEQWMNAPFVWALARAYDSIGDVNGSIPKPVNSVVYKYQRGQNAIGASGEIPDSGLLYVSDIYFTPPRENAASALTSAFAHHVHVSYEKRPDPQSQSFWSAFYRMDRRVVGVDVTSKPFDSTTAARSVDRRYHLSYRSGDQSVLQSVTMEGRCSPNAVEGSNELLPTTMGCPSMPATTFGYTDRPPLKITGFGTRANLDLLSTIDTKRGELVMPFIDVTGDGLPDLFSTDPNLYRGRQVAFVNRLDGDFKPTVMSFAGVGGDTEAIVHSANPNVLFGDFDGNGRVDMLHMPKGRSALYTLSGTDPNIGWVGKEIGVDVGLGLEQDGPNVRVADINGDGAADIIRTTSSGIETYFSLAGVPGGYGRFGTATRTSAIAATLSPTPARAPALTLDGTVMLSDASVRIVDMNGDRLADIAVVRDAEVRYWPGRGDGSFGDDSRKVVQSTQTGGYLSLPLGPAYAPNGFTEYRFGDVTGDKLADFVTVTNGAVQVWENVNGTSFRDVVSATGGPTNDLVRSFELLDLDKDGARSLVWVTKSQIITAQAADARPILLRLITNGFGATTELEYSSARALLHAPHEPGTGSGSLPGSLFAVSKVTVRDNLDRVGQAAGVYVSEYRYDEPTFDPVSSEFRGFKVVTVRNPGDASSPTTLTRSTYHLGECVDDRMTTFDDCAAEEWRGNPRDALRGLVKTREVFDETGQYLSTTHYTYALRRLYQTDAGQWTRFAYPSQVDELLYDTTSFVPATSTLSLPEIGTELTRGQISEDRADVTQRAANPAHLMSYASLDSFGNLTDRTDAGCIAGCPAVDEAISTRWLWDRPAGDVSKWSFRMYETWVTGSAHPNDQRNHTFTDYNAAGYPTGTRALLAGSLPLDRFHEAGAAVAPAPANASTDGMKAISTLGYDDFGNVVTVRSPNHRCAGSEYDSLYGELMTRGIAYVGDLQSNGCGAIELNSFATYDRGLAVVKQSVAYNGELATFEYDELGRIKKGFKPDPTTLGKTSSLPFVKFEYDIVEGRPYAATHIETLDGATTETSSYRNSWSLADGLGRNIVSFEQADPGAGDGGAWVASGFVSRDAKGHATRVPVPWFSNNGDPKRALESGEKPSTQATAATYDAFGRLVFTYAVDGAITQRRNYHALSMDVADGEDLSSYSVHGGTPSTLRVDGHGRSVSQIARLHDASRQMLSVETRASYLPTGEVERVTRENLTTHETVVRWMAYDSLGRRVLNADPDASMSFNPDGAITATLKAWRYAYNDNGELVGTSDARGCGENIFFDAGGRVVAEDFSPCLSAHQAYTAPDLATGKGTELFNQYDFLRATDASTAEFPIDTRWLRGKLTASFDRGAENVPRYDGRGRLTGVARKIAKPGATSATLADRFTSRWYTKTADYDGADRIVGETTGAKVAELLGSLGKSAVTTTYSKRGAMVAVGGSYGALLTQRVIGAEGTLREEHYGDAASTQTVVTPDGRFRPQTVQTFRAKAPQWSASPPVISPAPNASAQTSQLVLESLEYGYDLASNPISIRDTRTPDEWPAGAKPASLSLTYDDLYRVTNVTTTYAGGADRWVSPFKAENDDATRAQPVPQVSFPYRSTSQGFTYDWLGNTTVTSDTTNGFYDRSLGTVTNGTSNAGPYQLKSASLKATPKPGEPSTEGNLGAQYDAAGNMTSVAVQRNGPCLPSLSSCSQQFVYSWDEVGNLARARRWNIAARTAGDPIPTRTPDADLAYTYGADHDRVIKSATDANGNQLHSVYVFGSLELRRARWIENDFERTASTESVRLGGLARVIVGEQELPSLTSGRQHVLLTLGGHLGSTATVIDKATGELVEKTTYRPYGATDSDYRPERWKSFREDYKFTGKEDDSEVGLTYFGHRYLAPQLGRWASADPLAVHALGSDLNEYAYVGGHVASTTDPNGLLWAVGFFDGQGGTYGGGGGGGAGGSNGETTYIEGEMTCPPGQNFCAGIVAIEWPGADPRVPHPGSGSGDGQVLPPDIGGGNGGSPNGGAAPDRGGLFGTGALPGQVVTNQSVFGAGLFYGTTSGLIPVIGGFAPNVGEKNYNFTLGMGMGQVIAGTAVLLAIGFGVATGGAGFAVIAGVAAVLGTTAATATTVVAAGAGAVALAGVANMAIGVANAPSSPEEEAAEKASSPPRGSNNPNTRAASARGSSLHSDKPGNLPEQLRQKYPDTKFEFKGPGQSGQDVKYVSGTHPSEYPESTWPKGVDYGDFKPGNDSGLKTFRSDQANKWSDPTVYLPYEPSTGKLQ